MKTKRFCELIERALMEEYGEESNFDTVPHIPQVEGGDGRPKECLGVFLLENVHMAKVAAKAMYILWQDHTQDPEYQKDDASEESADIDEAMGDFVELMGGMRVAPYMQWHCAYFPYLTAEQVLAESEAGDSVDDRLGVELAGDGSIAYGSISHLPEEVQDVIVELEECAKLEGVDLAAVIRYARDHADEVVDYRNNGMKISEIADSLRSIVNVTKGE